jgi:hypothetical protein
MPCIPTAMWNHLLRWVVVALVGLTVVGSARAADEARKETVKVELPKAAADALKKAYKKATTGTVRTVEVNGVSLFDVDLTRLPLSGHVLVAADGTIVFLETVMPFRQVPKDVVTVVEKAAEGAPVTRAAMLDTFFEVKDGSLTQVAKGIRREFEVRFVKGDQEGTIVVDDRGNVVKPVAWKVAEKKEETGSAKEPQPAASGPAAKEAK